MFARFKAKGVPGVMAIVPFTERIDLAHVERSPGMRPVLRMLDSFKNGTNLSESLQRLAAIRSLHSACNTTLLAASEYQVSQMEPPAVPLEERSNAVRWKLKELVDFPVDSASIGVLDVPVEGGRQPSIFAVAAPAEKVSGVMSAFAEAKVPLDAIDIPELAQRNVSALLEVENRGLALLSLCDAGSLLTITFRGELFLARRTEISAQQMASADEEGRGRLFERLMLEMQRTLDNFDRQYGFITISSLLVSSCPTVDGLLPYLTENLYVPVSPLDLTQAIDCSAIPELQNPERQAQCLMAIGAALREGAAI